MAKDEEDGFMVAFAAMCCAYMFGPGGRQAKVPKDIWEFISHAENVTECNWSQYVLRVICDCAATVEMNVFNCGPDPNSIKLGGCWLYLEVWVYSRSVLDGEF